VVAARDSVEARTLGLHGLVEKVARLELLMGATEEVLGHFAPLIA
jgi:hypothetical protein